MEREKNKHVTSESVVAVLWMHNVIVWMYAWPLQAATGTQLAHFGVMISMVAKKNNVGDRRLSPNLSNNNATDSKTRPC
jgi:hypothetical protein